MVLSAGVTAAPVSIMANVSNTTSTTMSTMTTASPIVAPITPVPQHSQVENTVSVLFPCQILIYNINLYIYV